MNTPDRKPLSLFFLAALGLVAALASFATTSPARADDDDRDRGGRRDRDDEEEEDEDEDEDDGPAAESFPVVLSHDVQVRIALARDGSADKRRGRGRGRGRNGMSASAPDATPADPWMGLAVWEKNGCGACHGVSGGGGSAENVRRESAGEIREVAAEGADEMPRYPLFSAADARDVAAFLANAANTIGTRPAPVAGPGTGGGGGGGTTTPTWSGGIQRIFSANCAGCHQGTSPPAGVKLSTYANVKANAGRSLASIRNGSMPPAGAIASSDVDAIAAWIAGGMPE